MSKVAVAAWMFVVVCTVAALVAIIAQPVHWERTLGLAVVLGIGVGFFAARQPRAV